MKKEKIFMFAGSIGGNVGSSGGSTGGNSSDCIIVNSLNAKDQFVYIEKIRNWRDEVLTQTSFGRVVINTYYIISPKLVNLSKKIPVVKKPVKAAAILVANLV